MTIIGLVVLAIILAAVCYSSRCMNRADQRKLPPEIQRELDPFGVRR